MNHRRRIRNKRSQEKKEKAIMLASAVLVLTALTLTGVYVKESENQSQDNGYIDFQALDESTKKAEEKIEDIEKSTKLAANEKKDSVTDTKEKKEEAYEPEQEELFGLAQLDGELDYSPLEESVIPEPEEEVQTVDSAQVENPVLFKQELSFQPEDGLVWPIVGNVLIPYSMDKSVYFATLDQYKYNEGIVISANVSDMITASCRGKITEIYSDDVYGTMVKMEIGNGYEIVYGQLKDLAVSEGSFVEEGEIIGYVSEPTKYFSVEGTNVFFALYKDGEAINPETCLE